MSEAPLLDCREVRVDPSWALRIPPRSRCAGWCCPSRLIRRWYLSLAQIRTTRLRWTPWSDLSVAACELSGRTPIRCGWY